MPTPRESLWSLYLFPSTGHWLLYHPDLDLGCPHCLGSKDLTPAQSHHPWEGWPFPSKREERRDQSPEYRDQNGDSNPWLCPQGSPLTTLGGTCHHPFQPQTKTQVPEPPGSLCPDVCARTLSPAPSLRQPPLTPPPQQYPQLQLTQPGLSPSDLVG